MAFFMFNDRIPFSTKKDIIKANKFADPDQAIDYLKNRIRKAKDLSYSEFLYVTDDIDADKLNDRLKEDTTPYIKELEVEITKLITRYNTLLNDTKKHTITSSLIQEEFNGLELIDWTTFFYKKTDYDLYTKILTDFFTYNTYTQPQNIIKIKPRVKGKLSEILKTIYQKTTTYSDFSKNINYHDVLRLLSCYMDRNHSQLITDFRR